MPLYTIENLKTALRGGAKSDKYYIELGTPVGAPDVVFRETDTILCFTASFPKRTIGEVDAFVQGRKLKLPGDSVFDQSWELEFYQTPDHDIRSKLITWMNKIDTYIDNYHTCTPQDFMVTARIHQVACDGTPSATYEFYNVFPNEVGDIQVGSDKINEIEKFTVSLTYSHWEKVA